MDSWFRLRWWPHGLWDGALCPTPRWQSVEQAWNSPSHSLYAPPLLSLKINKLKKNHILHLNTSYTTTKTMLYLNKSEKHTQWFNTKFRITVTSFGSRLERKQEGNKVISRDVSSKFSSWMVGFWIFIISICILIYVNVT